MQAGRESAQEVEVKLVGRQNEITAFASQRLRLHVDVRGLGPGKHRIRLSARNVMPPAGVKVVQIIPQSIVVDLNRIGGKSGEGTPEYE
jgi:YbbR domain-containing protein